MIWFRASFVVLVALVVPASLTAQETSVPSAVQVEQAESPEISGPISTTVTADDELTRADELRARQRRRFAARFGGALGGLAVTAGLTAGFLAIFPPEAQLLDSTYAMITINAFLFAGRFAVALGSYLFHDGDRYLHAFMGAFLGSTPGAVVSAVAIIADDPKPWLVAGLITTAVGTVLGAVLASELGARDLEGTSVGIAPTEGGAMFSLQHRF